MGYSVIIFVTKHPWAFLFDENKLFLVLETGDVYHQQTTQNDHSRGFQIFSTVSFKSEASLSPHGDLKKPFHSISVLISFHYSHRYNQASSLNNWDRLIHHHHIYQKT